MCKALDSKRIFTCSTFRAAARTTTAAAATAAATLRAATVTAATLVKWQTATSTRRRRHATNEAEGDEDARQ